MCGIHTTLMNKVFGVFVDQIKLEPSSVLSRKDYAFTGEFCASMCRTFLTESARQIEATMLMKSYFGSKLPLAAVQFAENTPDAGIKVAAGRNASNEMMIFFREDRNEMCVNSRSSPNEKNIGYYLRYIHLEESKFARQHSNCPALLMSLVGPWLSVSFVVFDSSHALVDPIVPFLPTLVLLHDKASMARLALVFKAVKGCCRGLRSFYKNLVPDPTLLFQPAYPYHRHFVSDSFGLSAEESENHPNSLYFNYVRAFSETKLVFEVEVPPQAVTSFNYGTFVVKFVQIIYCTEAHMLCCHNGSAPRLVGTVILPGGWTMLVMEFVTGRFYDPKNENEAIENALTRAAESLHRGGFVHGDLRECNIFVDDVTNTVKLIDFDWAGIQGEVRYPGFMNHDEINWPKGADDGKHITFEHDLHFLRLLLHEPV